MPSQRLLLAAACATLVTLAIGHDAHACACSSNPAHRNVTIVPFDAVKRDEIGRLRFAGTAQLFVGEADPADIKGIATPARATSSAPTGTRIGWCLHCATPR